METKKHHAPSTHEGRTAAKLHLRRTTVATLGVSTGLRAGTLPISFCSSSDGISLCV